MKYSLRIAGRDHEHLKGLLYPGDGLEAGAIAVCGRLELSGLTVLLTQEIHEVPSDAYVCRKRDLLDWNLEWMTDLINEAELRNLSLVKFHSHPGGFRGFSPRDDASDLEILSDWAVWYGRNTPHASAVMLPDGELFARVWHPGTEFSPVDSVSVAGIRYHHWTGSGIGKMKRNPASERNIQAFGAGTVDKLAGLRVAVIGCSGTGSVTYEQLARLEVGEIVLVEPEAIEEKNLNRILNSSRSDALDERPKVDIGREAIERIKFSSKVTPIEDNLIKPEVVRQVASCDVIFGCVDSAEARHVLNRLATYYVIPYFDVGVALQADGDGGVSEITGVVHYLQPGGSSLLSRGAYSLAEVEAESMLRLDPTLYEERRRQNYIAGVDEDRPAVLPVNMHFASLMVMEFLARLHGYRYSDDEFAIQQYNLEDPDKVYRASDGDPCPGLSKHVGKGDVAPLLDMPILEQ